MMKVYLMIIENYERGDSLETVADVTVFADEQAAIEAADQEAELRGYAFDNEAEVWFEVDTVAGTIRVETADVHE